MKTARKILYALALVFQGLLAVLAVQHMFSTLHSDLFDVFSSKYIVSSCAIEPFLCAFCVITCISGKDRLAHNVLNLLFLTLYLQLQIAQGFSLVGSNFLLHDDLFFFAPGFVFSFAHLIVALIQAVIDRKNRGPADTPDGKPGLFRRLKAKIRKNRITFDPEPEAEEAGETAKAEDAE